MITWVRIESLALIDRLEVEFSPGLNVLTGETGAGKSIVLGALDLLLGARASTEVIRRGAERAVIEGLFVVNRSEVTALLHELDLADADPSTLLIRRVVARNGRNKITVNGNMVTLSMLRQLVEPLLDMCSQHAQYALLEPRNHLEILDRFAGLTEERERYSEGFRARRELLDERSALQGAERERLEREDFLVFELKQIRALELEEGEEERLEAEVRRLKASESLKSGAYEAGRNLSEDADCALSRLREADGTMQRLVDSDAALSPLVERLSSARIEIEDIAFELQRYASSIDAPRGALEAAEDRLHAIRRLLRKYGPTIAHVLENASEMEAELERFAGAEERLEALELEIQQTSEVLLAEALELSAARRAAAERLEKLVETKLTRLAMASARLAVEVWSVDDVDGMELTETGVNRVMVRLAANQGEQPLPLARCASGGELSRILLAIKSVLLATDPVPTSVFDEVDAGVGGGVAEIIGQDLSAAAVGRQVLCITHSPQIAAYADTHIRVSKHEDEGRTFTRVEPLSREEQLNEVARMLGGIEMTEQALDHARQMLTGSQSFSAAAH